MAAESLGKEQLSPPKSQARLEILLADYQAAREDERGLAATQSALISVAATLLALMAAGISQTCAVNAASGCFAVPDYFLAALPLAPAVLACFLVVAGAASTIRSYYLRALERELQGYAPEDFVGLPALRPASYISLVTQLTSLRRGRPGYRFLTNYIFLAIVVIFGGLTYYIAVHVSDQMKIFMAVLYLPFAVVLFGEIFSITAGGRNLFIRAVEQFAVHTGVLPAVERPDAIGPQRNLVSYLLLPRPEDWPKWLIAPGVIALVVWVAGADVDWKRFVITWLIMELLIYEARYQWNDIRGLAEDQKHAEQKARGRLPIGITPARTRTNIATSAIVSFVKLALAIFVGYLAGVLAAVLSLIGLIVAIAVVYEVIRSIRVPASVVSRRVPVSSLLIWLIVGLGYGVRAAVGLTGAHVPLTGETARWAIACLVFFGIMFVLLTWVLEAASLGRTNGTRWWATSELIAKPHLAALMRFAGVKLAMSDAPPQSRGGRKVKLLEPLGRVFAPWNTTFVLAVACGEVFVGRLAGLSQAAVNGSAVIGVAGAIVVSVAWRTIWRLVALALSVALLSALHWTLLDVAVEMTVPLLVVGAWYIMFRASSYHDLKVATKVVVLTFVRIFAKGYKSLLGGATWRFAKHNEAMDEFANRLVQDGLD